MKELHNWLFTYNSYTGKYMAAHREHYHELWSGGPNVIKSSSQKTLEEIIIKTGGDTSKLKINE